MMTHGFFQIIRRLWIQTMLIIPAVRIYGMWFIILLHFTVFLLLLDADIGQLA